MGIFNSKPKYLGSTKPATPCKKCECPVCRKRGFTLGNEHFPCGHSGTCDDDECIIKYYGVPDAVITPRYRSRVVYCNICGEELDGMKLTLWASERGD